MRVLKVWSEEETIQRIRGVNMLCDTTQYPYKDAVITIEKMNPRYLHPTQRYLLRNNLETIRSMSWEISAKGHPLADLRGALTLQTGEDATTDLLPPIVEEFFADNRCFHVICDGMHRSYLSMMGHCHPNVIFIRGIPKDLAYYAYPLVRGWKDVTIMNLVTEGFIKKWHRVDDNKKLYRDFNSVFSNVGGPRG